MGSRALRRQRGAGGAEESLLLQEGQNTTLGKGCPVSPSEAGVLAASPWPWSIAIPGDGARDRASGRPASGSSPLQSPEQESMPPLCGFTDGAATWGYGSRFESTSYLPAV